VWERPADAFVAGFVGTPPMNLLEGRVVAGAVQLRGACAALPPALPAAPREGLRVHVGVRPEAFAPVGAAPAEGLVATLEPDTCELLGAERLVTARIGAERVTVRLAGSGPGLPERVAAPASALHLFEAEGGRRLGP
jgi:ABC-type sugar transport system ATPase subunit